MARRYRIAILGGTGAEGSGLAVRLAAAGHHVTIGSRDAEKAKASAAELSAMLDGVTIDAADNQGAAAASGDRDPRPCPMPPRRPRSRA